MAPRVKQVAAADPAVDDFTHEATMKRLRDQVPENTDFTAPRKEKLFSMPSFLASAIKPMICDDRDWLCVETLFNVLLCLVVPQIGVWFAGMYLPAEKIWMLNIFAPTFLVFNILMWYGRYILMLHYTSHRRLFKNTWINNMNEIVISPFIGIPSGAYFLHHVVMHHIENNIFPFDVSSTMEYQRDNFFHLLQYIARYWTHAFVYLPYYAIKKKRYNLAVYYFVTIGSYFAVISYLYSINPVGTTWTFIVPAVVCSILLMSGNFSQHMFLHPEIGDDSWGNSYNLICTEANQLCFNDGYHIVHHVASRLHWRDMPKYFEDNVEKCAQNDSLVFKGPGLDNLIMLVLVMTGNYKKLYESWVQLHPQKRSFDDFKEMCKERLKPFKPKPKAN